MAAVHCDPFVVTQRFANLGRHTGNGLAGSRDTSYKTTVSMLAPALGPDC
jgi:hypothetical protein